MVSPRNHSHRKLGRSNEKVHLFPLTNGTILYVMTLKTLEKAIQMLKPEEQRKFLRDLPALIRLSKEDLARLKAAEKSFSFWNNPEDAVYDHL
jgi:hypothetical protein